MSLGVRFISVDINTKMKQLLFSVTKDDFNWQFFRAGGHGGQHKDKKDTACRCVHPESGAKGESRDERSQSKNKQQAFTRCVNSKEFQNWLKHKTAATLQGFKSLEHQVEQMMKDEFIKTEYYEPRQ